MTNAISTITAELTTLVTNIDITSIAGKAWQFTAGYPLKQPQAYPGFSVVPIKNTPPITIDTVTFQVPYTFAITILHSFESAETAESQIEQIADLVFDTLFQMLMGGTFLPDAGLDWDIAGTWGFNPDYGERFYRIEITAHTTKELELSG